MIYIGIEFGSEVLSQGHTILDQINTPSKNLHRCRVGYILLLCTVLVRKKRPDSAEDSDISFQFLYISFHKHIRKQWPKKSFQGRDAEKMQYQDRVMQFLPQFLPLDDLEFSIRKAGLQLAEEFSLLFTFSLCFQRRYTVFLE